MVADRATRSIPRRRIQLIVVAWLGSLAPSSTAVAQPLVPSMEVIDEGAPVYVLPRRGAVRRGRLIRGTRVPFRSRRFTDGCETGGWIEIGADAFVCERHLQPSSLAPGGVPQPVLPPGELLPRQYAFVRYDATPAYTSVEDYLGGDHHEALGEGFGVVVVDRMVFEGVAFFRTQRGLFIEADALSLAGGSTFEGISVEIGEVLNHAWVLRPTAIRAAPGGRVVRRAHRREIVRVAEDVGRGFVRLVDGTFVQARSLARTELVAPPSGLHPMERWLDVNVDQQVLVAYEGPYPKYATLVSTGRRRPQWETPVGQHRIWVKLAYSDMSDLGRTDVSQNYAIEGVPWVQYFEGSNGLHAAFWHDDFGRARSHGCVNLSPRDARWLFEFTGPALPAGWDAIFSTDQHPGTLIQVR